MYGPELLIDLKDADTSKFTRESLGVFLDTLCAMLDVEPQDRHFWDDQGVPDEERQTNPKTKGTTVIQFLLASNITIHTLDLLDRVYINVFVCRDFDAAAVVNYSKKFFDATLARATTVVRL